MDKWLKILLFIVLLPLAIKVVLIVFVVVVMCLYGLFDTLRTLVE